MPFIVFLAFAYIILSNFALKGIYFMEFSNSKRNLNLSAYLRKRPNAEATLVGDELHSSLRGVVRLYETTYGTLVVVSVSGLPLSTERCRKGIFALHMHSGPSCTGNSSDPFANVGMHYNPNSCMHPYHSGDMPPLFSSNGNAFLAFITDRFSVDEAIGKAIVIHDSYDDFSSQPSGNSGNKIACGIII